MRHFCCGILISVWGTDINFPQTLLGKHVKLKMRPVGPEFDMLALQDNLVLKSVL